MAKIDLSFGRQAFGADPAGYDASRPDYPDWVFETLVERCGLAPGCAAFEVGAGTGKATRRVLALGADPLVAVEPDARLAAYLRSTAPDTPLQVVVALYSTYSDMNIRPPDERARVLTELHRIARDQFAGRVTRNMQTILYTAQRR